MPTQSARRCVAPLTDVPDMPAGEVASVPLCGSPSTTTRTIGDIEMPLCETHAAEIDAEAKEITLLDFANSIEYPVLFWVSSGVPTGDYHPIGYPEFLFHEERELEFLTGTVDVDGEWNWDGEGDPTDYQRNTITRLTVLSDKVRWESIVSNYENSAD